MPRTVFFLLLTICVFVILRIVMQVTYLWWLLIPPIDWEKAPSWLGYAVQYGLPLLGALLFSGTVALIFGRRMPR